MNRRHFIKMGGVITAPMISGCTSSSDGSTSDSSFTQTPASCGDESNYVSCNGNIKLIRENAEQRGQEVWVTGEIQNISGKPLEHLTVLVDFEDQTGSRIKTIQDTVHALIHNEVWKYEIRMNGSGNEKRAISSWSTRTNEAPILDTAIPSTNADSCGNASIWQCDDRIKVTSIHEDWVTREHSGEQYMVFGEVENIGDNEIAGVFLAANYVDSAGRIIAHAEGSDEMTSYIKPGDSDEYRISFGNNQPRGELDLRIYRMLET